MAQGVTPDGIPVSNRVETLTERKLHAAVVDNILNSATYASRLMGMGRPFMGKVKDYTVKITDSGLGQFFTGLETLSTSASDTTITLSYAHTAFAQPKVNIMLEAFANAGQTGTINLGNFKDDEAVAETVSRMGTALYGTGAGDQPLGLEALIDDGTNAATIGGQSRSTYTNLQGTVTDSGGTLTLAKLATLQDSISASGLVSEEPNINVTTKTVWSLYEELLQPQVRASYQTVGTNSVLPIRGSQVVSPQDARGTGGFTALTYRGNPVIKDDKATSGVWYMVNERYLFWLGRTIVPEDFKEHVTKVGLGKARTMEGVGANRPSDFNGMFFQKDQMLPNQAGIVGRYYVIGQFATNQPRRHGKLTGITSV
jgi:hypothetical protein